MSEFQLDLFQRDVLALAGAYRRLASLEFAGAREGFAKVLQAVPDHNAAGNGMKEARFWEDTIGRCRVLDNHAAFCFLWENINSYPFAKTEWHEELRLALIGYLLDRMESDPDFYAPPDLCRGYLYLQRGDFARAEQSLAALTEKYPENGRLLAWLADAFFIQGKSEKAGGAYAKSLLMTPHDVPVASLRNGPLVNLIMEHGPALAPVYAYFAGLLPAVVPDVVNPTVEYRIFALIREAERAMNIADHEAMVEARRSLKRLAPEVLRDYLAWLAQ